MERSACYFLILTQLQNELLFLPKPANILKLMKETLINSLPYIQIGLSVLLVISILLQHSESGVSGSFGGSDNFSSSFHTRRGFEKFLFRASIVIVTLFAASALAALWLKLKG